MEEEEEGKLGLVGGAKSPVREVDHEEEENLAGEEVVVVEAGEGW